MLRIILLLFRYAFICISFAITHAHAGEWSGNIAVQGLAFVHDGMTSRQSQEQYSLSFQPEYYTEWNEGKDSFTFEPFIRIDSRDDERTHADIRELIWIHAADDWELRLGVGKVFWGVTESRHLVDIINQTDLVENIDGEDKLGQPMIDLSLIREWGTVDLFLLPGFRERTFPGKSGRLRTIPHVDVDHSIYESSSEEKHVDWAVRWSHAFEIWDIGLAHFSGTSREPRLIPALDKSGQPVLIPLYELIDQTSLDVQATVDSWLWKLEWLTRTGQGDRFSALVGGFEYTLYGLFESSHDLGLLAEYHFDDRGNDASTLFEDDLFMGARWVWNDVDGTEILAGVIQDLSSSERTFRLEASKRVGQGLKVNVEAQFFSNIARESAFYSIGQDDFIQVELSWYF
jgi:hypothetical protein